MIFATLEHILTHISFSIISIVIPTHLMTLVYEIVGLYDSSEKGMIATFSFHILETIFSKIAAVSAILTQRFAASGLLTKMHQSAILVPALQSRWLMMHASMMLLSYAAILCGSLLSKTLLVIMFRRKIDIFSKTKKFLISSFYFDETQYMNFSFRNYHSYHVNGLGFTFLTIGILSGAVWTNEAWGSYWNWDPKQTWAFITWTVFAIYLHTRTNKSLQGTNSIIMASMGFLMRHEMHHRIKSYPYAFSCS
ncbi:unnamed protein product [Victoria cruziana]